MYDSIAFFRYRSIAISMCSIHPVCEQNEVMSEAPTMAGIFSKAVLALTLHTNGLPRVPHFAFFPIRQTA
jgi:hypothetical protein